MIQAIIAISLLVLLASALGYDVCMLREKIKELKKEQLELLLKKEQELAELKDMLE